MSASFLKIASFLQKLCAICFLSNFPVLSSFFKLIFSGLQKHCTNKGFQHCLAFLLFKEKKKVLSKNVRFVTVNCFSEIGLLNPVFIVFLGCALFGPSWQKRLFGPKKETLQSLTDN